jgi:hypothetical protein
MTLCTLILLGSLDTRQTWADGPVSLAAYHAAAARAEQLVSDAATELDSNRRQTLCQQSADTLDAIRAVALDSGELLTLDNQSLVIQLRQPAPTQESARQLASRLRALQDGLALPAAHVDPADREKLRELLARPPFSQPVTDDWLARLIDDVLSRLLGGAARGMFDLRYVVAAFGIVVTVLVLVYFVVSLRRSGASEAVFRAEPTADELTQTAAAAFGGVQRYVAAGDYRSAVRLLYLGTLLRLDERGLLRFDRSLTNREYLRVVAGSPAIRDALRPVVETFDRTWYGFGPMDAGDFARYQTQVDALRDAHLS